MTAAWQFWQQEAEDATEGPDYDYSDMSKAQLAAELERRGLPKSGTKDELIARLQEDDTA